MKETFTLFAWLISLGTSLSEQTSHQHTFLSEQTASTNNQQPAKRTCRLRAELSTCEFLKVLYMDHELYPHHSFP
jgi:hypothetical protein